MDNNQTKPSEIPSAPPTRGLYKVKDAAEWLSCSPRKVSYYIAAGVITPTYLGKLVRIPVEELQRIAREGAPECDMKPKKEKVFKRGHAALNNA